MSSLLSRVVCGTLGRVYDLAAGRFPAVVRIETTNACNARCVICPHRSLKRPIRHMDDDLFARVVDECAEQRCKEVHLHNFGEPLLDKRLEERVRYAKARGIPKVKIFSNGSLLTRERARGLIEAGLDEVKISLDGATREEFERIRVPLKFDQVVENVQALVAQRDESGSPMRIKVACCSTTDKQGTMRALERMVDGFSFGKIHNWAGEEMSTSNDLSEHAAAAAADGRIRKPCSRVWRTFTILSSGDVALCCLDYDGQCLLGRLDAATTIRDMWAGAAYREVREKHRQARQDGISLCRSCTKSFL